MCIFFLNLINWTLLMLYCQNVVQSHYVVMRRMMIFIIRSQVTEQHICLVNDSKKSKQNSSQLVNERSDLSTHSSIDCWSSNTIFLQDRDVDPEARWNWRQLLHFLCLFSWGLKLQTFWWHVCFVCFLLRLWNNFNTSIVCFCAEETSD